MANKYIFQLRRGVRYINNDGTTATNNDGTPVRDDWTAYTNQDPHLNPLDGELVVEFEFNPQTGKKTPRFKIGCDDKPFADLEYISPDSFILPASASITLAPDAWLQVKENEEPIPNRYYQPVTVKNAVVTPNSKVDLQPSPEQLAIFHKKDLTFTAINAGGNVRVCVVGQKPTHEYTIQVTITEVV